MAEHKIKDLQPDEYGEYYSRYIRQVVCAEFTTQLRQTRQTVLALLEPLEDEEALYRYEPGKWSVKEVLGHVMDTERIFTYRALALARGETEPLAGYDHKLYVKEAGFDRFGLDELLEQYKKVRSSTLSLFQSFSDRELVRRGVVNGSNFTVRGLGFVVAGHELHHLTILRERYLTQ